MGETLPQSQLAVAVDVMLTTACEGELRVLLSQRTAAPYAHCWALPGRMVTYQETAENAAHAVLEELLPGTGAALEQLYTFSGINRDPRGRVVSVAYLAMAPWERVASAMAGSPMRAFTLVENSRLLLRDGSLTLQESHLAFDHGEMIRMGIERLRGKVEYTDIAFRYLRDPDAFTLAELQRVYEAILGRPTGSGNFQRMIRNRYLERGLIRQTARKTRGGQGRPAALFEMVN